MSSTQIPSLSRHLDLTKVVKIVDAFSDAVHEHAPLSWFYLDQAHHLSGRMRTLEKRIMDWDSQMILQLGKWTISEEEFQELEEETQSIRMAAKGIHGYFNYHLPRIQAEGPSTPSSSQGSSLGNFSDYSAPSTSNGYQSGSTPFISSDSSAGTSHGSPLNRVNTPTLSDVSSTSVPWSYLNNENGNGSLNNNYAGSEGGSSGSMFSTANAYAEAARTLCATPTPSLGQSSTSSYRNAQ